MFRFFTTRILTLCHVLLALFAFFGTIQKTQASLLGKSTKKALFVYYEQNATGEVKVNSEAGTLIYTDRLGQIIDPNAPKLLKNIGTTFKRTITPVIIEQFKLTSAEALNVARLHQNSNKKNILEILTKELKETGINFGVFRFASQTFIKGETSNCPSEISWKIIFESNGRYKFTDPIVQNSCFTYIESSYIAFKSANNINSRGSSNNNVQLRNAGLLSWKVYRKKAEEIYDVKRKGTIIGEAQIQVNEQNNFDNIDDNISSEADAYKSSWHRDCLYDVTKYNGATGSTIPACSANFSYIDTYAQAVSGQISVKPFTGFKKIMEEFNANYTDLTYRKKLEVKADDTGRFILQPTYTRRHISYQKNNACSSGNAQGRYETEYYFSYQLISYEDLYRATQEATSSNFDSGLADEQKGFQVMYENKPNDITDTTMLQNATLDNSNFLCNLDPITKQCKKTNVVVDNIQDTTLIDKLKDRGLDVVLAPIQKDENSSLEYQFKTRSTTQPLAQILNPGGQITVDERPDPVPDSNIFICDSNTARKVKEILNFSYGNQADRVTAYFECNPNTPKNQQRFYTDAWGSKGKGHSSSWVGINMNVNNSNTMNPYNLRPHWDEGYRDLRSSYSVIDTCNTNDNTCGIRFHFGYDGSGVSYMDGNYNNYAKMTNQAGDSCGRKAKVCTSDHALSRNRLKITENGPEGYSIYPYYDDNGSVSGYRYSDGYGSSGECILSTVREECIATPPPNIQNFDFYYCMGNPNNVSYDIDLTKQYRAIENGNQARPIDVILRPIN